MTSSAAPALAAALATDGSVLAQLWLGANALDDDAAKAIGLALPRAASLRELWLDHNRLTASGARALLDGGTSDLVLADGGEGGARRTKLQLWLDGNRRVSTPERAELVELARRRGGALQLRLTR